MRVGYCVPVVPAMASYRLRVNIPARNLGCQYVMGPADVCFFYKHQAGDVDTAIDVAQRGRPIVYDVVNDHFHGPLSEHYRQMCDLATVITAGSETMAARVLACTGREATVIDDPWETPEAAPGGGDGVLWFGHSANVQSLVAMVDELADVPLTVCTNIRKDGFVWWTQESERECLERCAAVLVTGNNPGASSNRIVKALRAGKFVIAPHPAPAWEQFADFIWTGGVADGLRWFEANRDEACSKILAGQAYSRDRFSPWTIGQQWRALFDSISAAATSASRDG